MTIRIGTRMSSHHKTLIDRLQKSPADLVAEFGDK